MNDLPPTTSLRLEDIWGTLPTVTAAPTWTPRNFMEGFAIDTTNNLFYFYNPKTNAWHAAPLNPGGSDTYVQFNDGGAFNGASALTYNKTTTKTTIGSFESAAATYSPSASGTATLDLSAANEHRITMPAGNITIALSNDTNAQKFIIEIKQDSGGSRTVTWFSGISWAGGSAPTLTTTASKTDVFGFIRTGTNTYIGGVVFQNI